MKSWTLPVFKAATQLIRALAAARARKRKKEMLASPSVIARRFNFVEETEGQNQGTWVNLFQRFTGNRPGDPWCASFVSFVLDIVYRGRSPLRRSGSCDELLKQCRGAHFIVSEPQKDDLFFYLKDGSQDDAVHVGIVTSMDPVLKGIAGNTSPDGKSTNGTGVFEHLMPVSKNVVFARLPR